MPDAFVTLVSIQPSASVQAETGREARSSTSKVKQGIFTEHRKKAVAESDGNTTP